MKRHDDPGTVAVDGAVLLLGDAGLSILHAVAQGARDPWAIHFMTGLPCPCIDARISVLLQFNVISMSRDGHLLPAPLGHEVLCMCTPHLAAPLVVSGGDAVTAGPRHS